MLASVFIDSLQKLSWSARMSFLILGLAVFLNLSVSFDKAITGPWRRMYLYKGVVCLMAFTYYVLLLTGWIHPQDFRIALQWVTPLLVSGLFTSALLHRWELGKLREKKRQEEFIHSVLEKKEENG